MVLLGCMLIDFLFIFSSPRFRKVYGLKHGLPRLWNPTGNLWGTQSGSVIIRSCLRRLLVVRTWVNFWGFRDIWWYMLLHVVKWVLGNHSRIVTWQNASLWWFTGMTRTHIEEGVLWSWLLDQYWRMATCLTLDCCAMCWTTPELCPWQSPL